MAPGQEQVHDQGEEIEITPIHTSRNQITERQRIFHSVHNLGREIEMTGQSQLDH